MNAIRWLFILPIVLLTSFPLAAQKKNQTNRPLIINNNSPEECGTPTPPLKVVREQEKLMQQFIQRGTNLVSPVVIPIKAHIVRKSDLSGGIAADSVLSAIAVMNTKYASINMSFSLCGNVHYIDSDELYELDVNTEDNQLTLNNVNDAINIYFVGTLAADGLLLNGISAFPSADPAENRIIMWNDATNNRITLPHEMGHYWNLYHTFETYLGKELVNGSNCSTRGDLVCDTPADPVSGNYNPTTCTYTGTATDSLGQAYNPMVNNLMSYYGLCRDIFTIGQYTRIDAGYALRTSYMSSNTYTLACNATVAAAPTNIQLTNVGCGLKISWTDNATNEMGYIIEAATSLTGPFLPIGTVRADSISFYDSRQLSNGTTYYYRIVAANANAEYSDVAQITFNAGTNCYCIPPAINCTDGDLITNVTIQKDASVLLNNASACSAGGYSVDSTALPTLERKLTYTLSVSNMGVYGEGATVWIDFNRNVVFENSELVFTKPNAIWTEASGSFTIPADAQAGKMRMRVKLTYESTPTDPCSNPVQSMGYGETEDYWINISCGVDSVKEGKRCGAGSVNLMAYGCSGGTINWYNTATGGTSIATGGTFTTPTLSSSTTYYVACESPCSIERMPVTATIIMIATNFTFTNPAEPAATFYASGAITSTTDVATGTNYYAGKSITLSPGFKVGENKVFTASIQSVSCP
ncbi:GEVED domain-containing protein [Emticicia fontis]